MEEYLTVTELSKRIKMAKQTIYNMIHKNIFVLNKHYHKPIPKKILFKWSEVKVWLEGNTSDDDIRSSRPAREMEGQQEPTIKGQPKSLINI